MKKVMFRGKSAHTNDWVYGNYVGNCDEPTICGFDIYHKGSSEWQEEKVEEFSVGQFTGLHDKNGKEIYEGDIVKTKYGRPCVIEWLSTVCFVGFDLRPEVAMSKYKAPDEYDLYNSDNLEVIGNIYDNPELLKEE